MRKRSLSIGLAIVVGGISAVVAAGAIRHWRTSDTVGLETFIVEADGSAVSQGVKQYSETALYTVNTLGPFESISIADDGSLMSFSFSFADPAVPADGEWHRYASIGLDSTRHIVDLVAAGESSDGGCTVRVTVSTTLPHTTTYSCDNDGTCATPSHCQLIENLINGKTYYSCECWATP